MKTFKTLGGTFLIIFFLASLAGCERVGSHGNGGQGGHGHSHE
ncbi:hypothetical protein [Polaromonas sp.]|nr:hypothetical protein [Polaromonas sp.]HQR98220.1 hypothetical protein [Polaromonas sp.]